MTPSQSSMATSADQFKDAVPARVSRPGSSASQSDTRPGLSLGSGTAMPLEQSPGVCACARPASPADSSTNSSIIDTATERGVPICLPVITRLVNFFKATSTKLKSSTCRLLSVVASTYIFVAYLPHHSSEGIRKHHFRSSMVTSSH